MGNPPVGIQVFGILKSLAIFKHRQAEYSQETQEELGAFQKKKEKNLIRLI